jgi:hypothetical protein
MNLHPGIVTRAKRNALRRAESAILYGRPINSDAVVDLLAATVGGGERDARLLLRWMDSDHWLIVAGVKKGGKGGPKRPPDMNLHVTVRFAKGGTYHAQLNASGHVWRVTNDDGKPISGSNAWVAPGA